MDLDLEIKRKVPKDLQIQLQRRDGAAQLVRELPKVISPDEAVKSSSDLQRAWELCGLYFMNHQRFHEALAVFYSLYDQMLAYQVITKKYVHKGMPLVWISDSHARLGRPVLAKRYLMLTTCEDAIRDKGEIPAETTGVYFRMVWQGVPHGDLSRYAMEISKLFREHPQEALFPEWILQELDQEWMTEFPSPSEALCYKINTRYVSWLLSCLGSGGGENLEYLAQYLLGSMPGCRAYRRRKSESTDYDVICTLEGPDLDFRSELGRYFVCECKDWSSPADFSAFAKFCRVLDSAKCRFGILFSKQGITGTNRTKDAEREQLKVFQDRGMVVIVISEGDLDRVAKGANFITLLRAKYEEVRLDLRK